ncbi:MAG: hypothetical protein RL518_2000 [Pseudomonadota bacterium]|jgi:hypothetical protein
MKTKTLLTLSLLATLMLSSGCVKKEDDDSTDSNAGNSSESTMQPFHTDCGTVSNGSLDNPVEAKGGIKGKVTVTGANLLIMTPTTGGPILIKLHALGVPYNQALQNGAKRTLEELAKEEAIFFPASESCTTTISTSTGMVGQVFTASGKSYSETLINQGYGRVEGDGCDASLIYSCYYALQEQAAQNFAGELEAFLWKPISDSNGKLAIHATPGDTVITVNGETGQDFSGGNGYANLARFSKPGCSYGKNVTVKITNSQGAPYRVNGKTSLTIPDGCQRYCLKNGQLALCPKK